MSGLWKEPVLFANDLRKLIQSLQEGWNIFGKPGNLLQNIQLIIGKMGMLQVGTVSK